MLVRTKENRQRDITREEAPVVLGTPATSPFERAVGTFGLFLIVTTCLAADRLPQKNSRPIERAVGYGAMLVIGAIGLIGRLIDRLSRPESGQRVEARKITGSAAL
jgi:hypothetical protein